MARQKGMQTLKGKVGNQTFKTGKYGKTVQANAEFTAAQKKAAAERPQMVRTGFFSVMGKPIRIALKYYAKVLMPGNFWAGMIKRFSKEKTEHRVLLLRRLEGMEVNDNYQFAAKCPLPGIEISFTKTSYKVDADISQPAYAYGDYNCYSLQFIFIVWKEGSVECRHAEESTEMISMKDKSPKFVTMNFKRTADDTEYMLVCRLELGLNGYGATSFSDTSMRILETGPVSVASKKILEERIAAEEKAKHEVKPEVVLKEKKKLVVRGKR